jgi:TrmH family RNA methyltransferase
VNPLANVVVVLDQTQDLVNIAGVVRAMKNMGLGRLRLVEPLEYDRHRITGIAHRTDDVLDRTDFYDSVSDAVSDAVYVLGTTARARTAGRNYGRPRELAPVVLERARQGTVALVFGREDRGLTNHDLDSCHAVAIIPTEEYSSLNLAQAFLIVAYELFLLTSEANAPLPRGRRATAPATQQDIEAMFGALEGGLEAIEFFKARKPESVMRTLRTILGRGELDQREARLVAAVGYEIQHYLNRTREPKGADQDGSS